MASDPKNPRSSPEPLGPSPSPGRQANLRAREAMEVLQRRGYVPTAPDVAGVRTPQSVDVYPKEVWDPHWSDTPISDPGDPLPTPEVVDATSGTPSDETIRPSSTIGRDEDGVEIEVDASDPRFETEDDPRIPPEQEFFRIGEASRIVGVKPHVLRFWETEFDSIVPEKTRTNQRRYRRKDIVRLLQIRRLRHDAKLTVAQTRSLMESVPPSAGRKQETAPPTASSTLRMERGELIRRLTDMRRDVVELLEVVEDDTYR